MRITRQAGRRIREGNSRGALQRHGHQIGAALRYFFQRSRGMWMLVFAFSLPYLALRYFTSLHIEVALMERKISSLNQNKTALAKRNLALRKAIAELAEKEAPAEPGRSEIVRIRMD